MNTLYLGSTHYIYMYIYISMQYSPPLFGYWEYTIPLIFNSRYTLTNKRRMKNQARKRMCFAGNGSVRGTEVWSEEAGETERERMDKKNEYKERQWPAIWEINKRNFHVVKVSSERCCTLGLAHLLIYKRNDKYPFFISFSPHVFSVEFSTLIDRGNIIHLKKRKKETTDNFEEVVTFLKKTFLKLRDCAWERGRQRERERERERKKRKINNRTSFLSFIFAFVDREDYRKF